MDWFKLSLTIILLAVITLQYWEYLKMRRNRDRWRRKAEWLAEEAVRAFKCFERIGGEVVDGPVTKEAIMQAADEAAREANG